MKTKIDFFFNYSNLIRFILVNKLNLRGNINLIPSVDSVALFFCVRNSLVYDDVQNYNFFYFFKFFFGQLPLITKFTKRLHLGDWFYDYNVELILKKKDVYFFFYFLSNDILKSTDEQYFFFNKKYFKRNDSFLYLNFSDVSLFSELKGNIGLFDLKVPLNIKVFFTGLNPQNNLYFLKQLKFKVF